MSSPLKVLYVSRVLIFYVLLSKEVYATLLHSSDSQQIPHNSFILLFFPFFILLESIWSKLDRFTCECSGVRMSWQYPKGLGRQPGSDAHGRPFTISGSSSFVSVMMLHQFLADRKTGTVFVASLKQTIVFTIHTSIVCIQSFNVLLRQVQSALNCGMPKFILI